MKYIIASLSIFLLALEAFASMPVKDNSCTTNNSHKNSWTFFRIGIMPNFPEVTSYQTYGLVLGLPLSGGKQKVTGLESAIISASTDYIVGTQTSVFVDIADKLTGFQGGLINVTRENLTGMQAGLTNISTGNMNGVQLSTVNTVSETASGAQLGIVNYAQKTNGIQIGIFNVASHATCQIGLINFISDNWLGFSILVNASFN